MSRENVEIVRAIYDESAEGRFWTYGHLFHPDVEYTRSVSGGGEMVGLAGRWRGLEAAVAAAMDWIETFEHLRVQAERYIDAGDSVVVLTRHIGKAKSSGLQVREEFADIVTLREGRVVRFDQYRDRAEALESVGLAE